MKEAIAARTLFPKTPIRHVSRFKYKKAVQDLFELNVVVFTLPERLLREYGDYFKPQTGIMPSSIQAASRPMGKSQMIEPRLAGVGTLTDREAYAAVHRSFYFQIVPSPHFM
tara:strand:- start:9074 stop:9409 length:336 start_codon:yes stop_codon:yes gene_type:complete